MKYGQAHWLDHQEETGCIFGAQGWKHRWWNWRACFEHGTPHPSWQIPPEATYTTLSQVYCHGHDQLPWSPWPRTAPAPAFDLGFVFWVLLGVARGQLTPEPRPAAAIGSVIGSWVGLSTGAGESRDANGKLSTCLSRYPSAHLSIDLPTWLSFPSFLPSFLPSFHLYLVLMYFSFLSSLLPCLLSVCLPSFSSFFRFLSLLRSTCLLVSASLSVNHSGCRFTCLPIYGSYLPCFAPLFLCLPNASQPFSHSISFNQHIHLLRCALSLSLALSLPLSLALSLSICLSMLVHAIYTSMYLSICLSACLSACLPGCLSVRPSVCPSVCLPINQLQSAYLSPAQSPCLLLCLSIHPSVPPSVYLGGVAQVCNFCGSSTDCGKHLNIWRMHLHT